MKGGGWFDRRGGAGGNWGRVAKASGAEMTQAVVETQFGRSEVAKDDAALNMFNPN